MENKYIIGALVGDFIGSIYEFKNTSDENFEIKNKNNKFTDDSVMTLAVWDILKNKKNITETLKKWGRENRCSYGRRFLQWILSDEKSGYNSFGNGSAMKISPVGWVSKDEKEVIEKSKKITEVTHNHPEGIKGAEVTAMCIYYAKIGKDKEYIKKYVESKYNFNFDIDYKILKFNYKFDISCQGTVPQAIYCFLISENFEDCLRKTIALGGDSDTLASISCSIAEAYYKEIPEHIYEYVINEIPKNFKEVLIKWDQKQIASNQ